MKINVAHRHLTIFKHSCIRKKKSGYFTQPVCIYNEFQENRMIFVTAIIRHMGKLTGVWNLKTFLVSGANFIGTSVITNKKKMF